MRYTEIIATDNGSSTHRKHALQGSIITALATWCSTQTTVSHLSIISVHRPSLSPSSSQSLRPSLVSSFLFPTDDILCKRRHSLDSFQTHCVFICLVPALVCRFWSRCFFFPKSISALVNTHFSQNVFRLPLGFWERGGSLCPEVRPPGAPPRRMRASAFRQTALWAMINLREPSRCLSSSGAALRAGGSRGTAGLPVAGSSTLSLLRGLDSAGLLSGPLTWNIFRPIVQHCS